MLSEVFGRPVQLRAAAAGCSGPGGLALALCLPQLDLQPADRLPARLLLGLQLLEKVVMALPGRQTELVTGRQRPATTARAYQVSPRSIPSLALKK